MLSIKIGHHGNISDLDTKESALHEVIGYLMHIHLKTQNPINNATDTIKMHNGDQFFASRELLKIKRVIAQKRISRHSS